jgi:hypothetical protein
MSTRIAPTNQYSEAAHSKFETLLTVYSKPLVKKDPRSYWKFGNTTDTMTDFLDIDQKSADAVAKAVVTQYDASLKALDGYDSAWFDDFGWWIIAFERAAQKSYFSKAAPQFRDRMSNCWSRFTGRAPFTWARHLKNTFPDCGPAVDGGVWNEYWEGTHWSFPGPKDGIPNSKESEQSLHGIQNSVTNAVYLISAQRLGVTDPKAKEDAEREFKFLDTWFTITPDPLWWLQPDAQDAALVRERVSHFAYDPKTKGYPPNKGYQAGWVWTGDQGLMIGALTDRIHLMGVGPDDRKDLLDRIEQLLRGVLLKLTDPKNQDELYPYTNNPELPPPGGDSDDYKTGPGVFWRNVLHAWNADSDVKALLTQDDYQQFLQGNAKLAIASQSEDFDDLTNDLAVLLAANKILKR